MNVRRVFIKSQLEIVTEKIHNVMIISDHFDQFTAIDDISVFVSILLPTEQTLGLETFTKPKV